MRDRRRGTPADRHRRATATGKTGLVARARRGPAATRPAGRDHLGRLAPGLPRHGHRHGQGRRSRARAASRTTASTSSTRTSRSASPTSPRTPARPWPASPRAAAWRSSSAAPGSTCGPSPAASTSTACRATRRSARRLEAELDADGLARARGAPPRAGAGAGRARSTSRNPRRVVRALEIAELRGDAPLPPPRRLPRAGRCGSVCAVDRPCTASGSRSAPGPSSTPA